MLREVFWNVCFGCAILTLPMLTLVLYKAACGYLNGSSDLPRPEGQPDPVKAENQVVCPASAPLAYSIAANSNTDPLGPVLIEPLHVPAAPMAAPKSLAILKPAAKPVAPPGEFLIECGKCHQIIKSAMTRAKMTNRGVEHHYRCEYCGAAVVLRN